MAVVGVVFMVVVVVVVAVAVVLTWQLTLESWCQGCRVPSVRSRAGEPRKDDV